MADFDNTNRGVLFRNKEKKSDKQPDYRGKLNVGGIDFAIAAWLHTSRKGASRRALCHVAAVLEAGKRSHPDDDGFAQPVGFHVERAIAHLDQLKTGDRAEHHLAHAAARLLMALQAE